MRDHEVTGGIDDECTSALLLGGSCHRDWGAAHSGAYIFVIPDDHRTYSALIVGLVLAAIASGYIARQAWLKSRLRGWLFVGSISAGVTVVTLLLSLFFILNSRGS
jgi:hypothetical protein